MNRLDRGQFLNFAGLFEGGLIVVAFLLGWLFDVDPVAHLAFTWPAIVWGVLATLPAFALFVISQHLNLRSMRRIHELLHESLGPSLAACTWYDLILLSALAGVAEEIFFRGLLQVWLERAAESPAAGLAGSNVAFGLAHAVTPAYALYAGLMGLYLGWLFDASGERNLLAPIITHGLYDYLAFLMLVRACRRLPEDTGVARPQSELEDEVPP